MTSAHVDMETQYKLSTSVAKLLNASFDKVKMSHITSYSLKTLRRHSSLARPAKPIFAGVVAVLATTLTVVHAEASQEVKPFVPERKKLSIYDPPQEQVIHVEEPTKLELAIRQARHTITDQFAWSRGQVQSVVDQWIQVEKKVSGSIRKYAAKDERFLPGSIYVILAGFGGSILTRNKGLLYRTATPTSFALLTFAYLYPGTSYNIFSSVVGDVRGSAAGATLLDVFTPVSDALNSIKDTAINAVGKASTEVVPVEGKEQRVITRSDLAAKVDEQRKTI
ncbi:apolipo protein O-domain-containing protein [Phlyctochytrium arcticum]|nr:apolipo protein O-domain-containing protein [Phlyctochytrium arcticum]